MRKLKSLFVATLTWAASSQKLGIHLIRVAILIIFVWIGGLKFWNYEAEGIVPFVANSPFMSFFYAENAPEYKEYKLKEGEFDPVKHQWHETNRTYDFSRGLGILIMTIGILTFLGIFSPKLGSSRSRTGHHHDAGHFVFPCDHSRGMGARFRKRRTRIPTVERSRTTGDKGYGHTGRCHRGAGRHVPEGVLNQIKKTV